MGCFARKCVFELLITAVSATFAAFHSSLFDIFVKIVYKALNLPVSHKMEVSEVNDLCTQVINSIGLDKVMDNLLLSVELDTKLNSPLEFKLLITTERFRTTCLHHR